MHQNEYKQPCVWASGHFDIFQKTRQILSTSQRGPQSENNCRTSEEFGRSIKPKSLEFKYFVSFCKIIILGLMDIEIQHFV